MKAITAIILITACSAFFSGQTAKNILKLSDEAYFPAVSKFNMNMKLYEDDKYDRYYELTCYIKGNQKYLAVFENPPIVRRRAQLRIGDKILLYMGKINRTTEISAKAAFAESTFSEEDVLSASLGSYYDLESTAEMVLNDKKIYKLTLKAKSKETAYSRIESFIDKNTLLPVKRYYYSYSNQMIKELKIVDVKKKEGNTVLIHLIMYDKLINGKYTEVIMTKFEYPSTLDDRIFTKRYMEIATQ